MTRLERWGHMRPKDVIKLADDPRINSNNGAIDPIYQPEGFDSHPQPHQSKPPTLLVEPSPLYRK